MAVETIVVVELGKDSNAQGMPGPGLETCKLYIATYRKQPVITVYNNKMHLYWCTSYML